MRLDDRLRERQAEPGPDGLRRVERLEELRKYIRGKPSPAIVASVGTGFLLLWSLPVAGKLIGMAGGPGGPLGAVFVLGGLIVISCGIVMLTKRSTAR